VKKVMTLIVFVSCMWPDGVLAVFTFNDSQPITADGTYAASIDTVGSQGGVLLRLFGTTGGAIVDLQVRGFGSVEETAFGGPIWQSQADCIVIDLPAECKVVTGPVPIRLIVSGSTGTTSIFVNGYRYEAVIAQVLGGGGDPGFALTAGCIDSDNDGNCEVTKDLIVEHVSLDVNDDGTEDIRFRRFSSSTIDIQTTTYHKLRFDPLGSAVGGAYASGVVTGPSIGTEIAGAWRNVTTTSTVPTGVMTFSDLTSGIGRDTISGAISLIDNSVEALRLSSTEVVVQGGLVFGFGQRTSAPFPCTVGLGGRIYFHDVLGLICVCDGVSNWEGLQTGGGPAIDCS